MFAGGTFQRHLAGAILIFVAAVISVHAAPLAVGDAVPAFSANDQFGNKFEFAPGIKFLLLGFDMTASRAANQKLAGLGTNALEKAGAVYVMDIHTMPAVARFFALPKMRKYPFRVVLAETPDLLAAFPRAPEKITVLALSPDGKIREVCYWNPVTEATNKVFD
jgi:hypothetical protein